VVLLLVIFLVLVMLMLVMVNTVLIASIGSEFTDKLNPYSLPFSFYFKYFRKAIIATVYYFSHIQTVNLHSGN
jgi:hypothetical protein